MLINTRKCGTKRDLKFERHGFSLTYHCRVKHSHFHTRIKLGEIHKNMYMRKLKKLVKRRRKCVNNLIFFNQKKRTQSKKSFTQTLFLIILHHILIGSLSYTFYFTILNIKSLYRGPAAPPLLFISS